MNTWRTISLAALFGLNPFFVLAQGDDLLQVWPTPGVSAKKRAAAVNRAFTNGTPVSLIVAKLGTNYARCGFSPDRWGLLYRSGRESVLVETSADSDGSLLSATFIRARDFDRPDPLDRLVLLLLWPGLLGCSVLLLALCFARTNPGLWICGTCGGLLLFFQDVWLRYILMFGIAWERGPVPEGQTSVLKWVDLTALVCLIAYCSLGVWKVRRNRNRQR
jgi:hypothetical protein